MELIKNNFVINKPEKELTDDKSRFDRISYLLDLINDRFKADVKIIKSQSFHGLFSETETIISEYYEQVLKQVIKKELVFDVDKRSIQLFNLGFYILNSQNTFTIPNEDVTDGLFDFKPIYSPDLVPIKLNDYSAASKLFAISFNIDPGNTLARIYHVVSLLREAVADHFDCIDSQEFVDKLRVITDEYPHHAMAHIELAYAYSFTKSFTLTDKHLEIALKLGANSSYINFKAFSIYFGNDSKKYEMEERLAWALDNDSNNPRYSIFRVHILRGNHDLVNAAKIMMSALKNKYYTENNIYYSKRIFSDLGETPRANYNSGDFEVEIIKGESAFQALQRISDLYCKDYNFKKFIILNVSENFYHVIIISPDFESQTYALKLENESIVFIDFNCTYLEIEHLNLLALPLGFSSGNYMYEDGVLFLKDLDFQEIFEVAIT